MLKSSVTGNRHLDGKEDKKHIDNDIYNQSKHVAFYILVSTKEQAEKGGSVEGQEKDLRDWLERTHLDWKLT